MGMLRCDVSLNGRSREIVENARREVWLGDEDEDYGSAVDNDYARVARVEAA